MKMLMKTEWKIKMQIKIKIKTKNTKQNINDDRKTQMQMQIEIKVAEPPRIPYLKLVFAVRQSFSFNLYKADTSLSWTPRVVPCCSSVVFFDSV